MSNNRTPEEQRTGLPANDGYAEHFPSTGSLNKTQKRRKNRRRSIRQTRRVNISPIETPSSKMRRVETSPIETPSSEMRRVETSPIETPSPETIKNVLEYLLSEYQDNKVTRKLYFSNNTN
jgi:hypothetical protein